MNVPVRGFYLGSTYDVSRVTPDGCQSLSGIPEAAVIVAYEFIVKIWIKCSGKCGRGKQALNLF